MFQVLLFNLDHPIRSEHIPLPDAKLHAEPELMCLDMLKARWLALLNSNTVLLDGLLNVIEGNTIDPVVPRDDLYALHVSLHQVMMRST